MDNKYKIISYLGKNPDKKYTMHELSMILKIPYASFYRTVDTLGDVLNIEKAGKSKMLSLNRENPATKAYLIIASEEEKKEFLKKHFIIRKIISELKTKDITAIFGSYAENKQTEKSDIDIIIINSNGKKSLSFSKYELLYRKKINAIFITKKEIRKMIKDKEENIGKQVLRRHVILNNPGGFWECITNGF